MGFRARGVCKCSLLHVSSTPLHCSYVALIVVRLFVLRAARVPVHQTAAPSPTSAVPRVPPDRLQRTHRSRCAHFCSSNGYTGPVHGKYHVSHAAARRISAAAAVVRAGGRSECLHCCVLTRVLLPLLVHAARAGTLAMHAALTGCLRAVATPVHTSALRSTLPPLPSSCCSSTAALHLEFLFIVMLCSAVLIHTQSTFATSARCVVE